MSNQDVHQNLTVPTSVAVGDFNLHFGVVAITLGSVTLPLTNKQARLLGLLLTRPGEYFSIKEIREVVWPELHAAVDTHSIQTTKCILKRTLHKYAPSIKIVSARSLGYRILVPEKTTRPHIEEKDTEH